MPANFPFNGYDNEVLENQIKSVLDTKLDINRFMTPDYSLEGTDGLKVVIHTYKGAGDAEDLARGEGNSEFITSAYESKEYVINRTQAQTRYYDIDAYNDSKLIESQLQTLAESMVNNWTRKAVGEMMKSENVIACTNYDLADFADAISFYANQYEDQSGLFFLASMDMVPVLRKSLGAYLMYTEDYIRSGALGSILGVPVFTSKAVPANTIIMATREAVTAFQKTGVQVESDHDIDTKENRVVASRYAVIALTDETRCAVLGTAQETALTAVADVSEGTIAGAATDGAVVVAYDANGTVLGRATASSDSYSIAAEFAVGDKIKVVATLDGCLNEYAHIEAVA